MVSLLDRSHLSDKQSALALPSYQLGPLFPRWQAYFNYVFFSGFFLSGKEEKTPKMTFDGVDTNLPVVLCVCWFVRVCI